MEYYSDCRNEFLQYVTTWMKLENAMLSEISQTRKYKYSMISSEVSKTINSQKQSRMVAARD